MKACSRCRRLLDFREFYPARRLRSGFSSWCRDCSNEHSRKRFAKDPAPQRAWQRKADRKSAGWAVGEHEKAEAARVGVTACACCGSPDPRNKKGWVADHDHATGTFRAYLCHPCNI